VKSVARDGREVLVNDELFLRALSPYVARSIVKWLREVKDAPEGRRDAIIGRALAASFDETKIRARVQEFEKQSGHLRSLANSLFILLYLLAPILVWRFGFLNVVWPLLAGLLAHTVALAFLFRRAHGQLYPNNHAERFTPFLTMLLAPPSAIRATDALGKHLLEDYHALAVAHVLLPPEQFRAFARRVLLDLHHPLFPLHPTADVLAVKTEQSFREALLAEAEDFAKRAGLKLEELLRPPARSESAHTAYCPRCEAQFLTHDSVCMDCGGRPLTAWP
jgi:hypothetical protein